MIFKNRTIDLIKFAIKSNVRKSSAMSSSRPATPNSFVSNGEDLKTAESSDVNNSVVKSPSQSSHQDDAGDKATNGKVNRLASFRALFDNAELLNGPPIHAYILPRTDAHNSEYISDRDLRVQFISGFSGSHGYAVITRERALLWTDGRYYIQAEKELSDGWTMMKWQAGEVSPMDWLTQNLERGARVGFDPQLLEFEKATDELKKLAGFGLTPVPIGRNLVDLIWADRPQEEVRKVIHLTAEECGEEPASKLARLRKELEQQKCDSIVVSQLDDIAWLYNLRGFDIPFNPVFFSFAFVTATNAYLFVDLRKLTPEVAAHLKRNSVDIFDYKDVVGFLKQYHDTSKAESQAERHKIWISQATNYEIGSQVDSRHTHIAPSPMQSWKTAKNETELDGIRRCHIRDSAALVKFFYWLKNELDLGHVVDENRASRQVSYYRAQQDKFVSLSFETISAADEHAALPHYRADEESGKKLVTREGVYLLDSGGQYRDGTTDVTRTVCFGEQPDQHLRQMFTLVLKAHLDCATTKFPAGTYDTLLDGIARAPLWRAGYDFGHGTGHGVGHFLNVHEIPPYIGYRIKTNFGLQKGTVVTIEPGYYEQGRFGIRIENCYELVEAKGLMSSANNFLAFAPLTLVPIQKSLIIREQLEPRHIDWLNRYHNACLESVGRYLQERGMQEEYNFLAQACTPF